MKANGLTDNIRKMDLVGKLKRSSIASKNHPLNGIKRLTVLNAQTCDRVVRDEGSSFLLVTDRG